MKPFPNQYKKGTFLPKKSIERVNDKKNDEIKMEFDQIMHLLESEINHADVLYENIPKLYEYINTDLDNTNELCLLDRLISSNIIQALFDFAVSYPDYVPSFLEFISRLSTIENSEKILNEDFISFLISQIECNQQSILISDIADILSNFSQSDAAIADFITIKGAIDEFLNILEVEWPEDLTSDQIDIIVSILSFFESILDIDMFQPINYFDRIVMVGFNYLNFPDDIHLSSLRLLCAASEGPNHKLFQPIIFDEQNSDVIYQIFLNIDSEDEESSSLSFDILLNITQQSDYEFRHKLLLKLNSQNELIDHLKNSIDKSNGEEDSNNENNIEYVLKFINNMIFSKYDLEDSKDDESKYSFTYIPPNCPVEESQEIQQDIAQSQNGLHAFEEQIDDNDKNDDDNPPPVPQNKPEDLPEDNPILLEFFEFLVFIILSLNEEMGVELKVIICQIFSKITDIATSDQILEIMDIIRKQEENKDHSQFVHILFSFFGISQECDYDLICIMYNILNCFLKTTYDDYMFFINSFIEVVGKEDLENLFDEPEKSIYTEKRDEVIKMLDEDYSEYA